MRVTAHPESRFLGFVQVKVASRVYSLPVEALPIASEEGSDRKAGFFADGTDKFGILVDSNASDGEQRETIQRASVDAAQHISRKVLN
jgi:hypothetical protein